MDLAVEFLIDFAVFGEARLTRDDVLEPKLRLHDRPAQLSFALQRPVHLLGPVTVSPAGPGCVRAGQPDRADEEQRGDEHPHQTRPHLAFEEHDDGEQQGQRRQRDHAGTRREGMIVAPDPDVEERQRVETENQQSGDGDGGEHRIDRSSPVLGPVHVLQMQDQRELIEYQCSPDSEKGCRDREFGYSPVDPQSHHRHTGDHDEDHTDNHMVDVQPITRGNVARLPPFARRVGVRMAADVPDDGACHKERENERDQAEHQRYSAMRDAEVKIEGRAHGRKLTPTCAWHARDTLRLADGHR